MIESLLHCQQLSMGLQLALAIDDAPLAASAVQAVYTSLTPLLRSRRRTIFVLQPLCHCLEALRLLGPTRLTSIKRAPHLLACVGFELATLANECGGADAECTSLGAASRLADAPAACDDAYAWLADKGRRRGCCGCCARRPRSSRRACAGGARVARADAGGAWRRRPRPA